VKDRTSQLVCTYCGYVFVVVFCIGFVGFAGFVPPPDPGAAAEQIAAFFRADPVNIRIGLCITLFASALLLAWGGAVSVQVKRLEGRYSPITYGWVAATACITIEFLYPSMFWAAAAFRPEDSPELIRKFNDLAWLPWLGIISTGVFQAIGLGMLTLLDRRPDPIYPRWFGYFQLWAAIGLCPADLDIFFKSGPLAWNGIITFWLPVTAAVAWLVVTTAMTARAVKRQPADPLDSPGLSAAEARELTERIAALETRLGDHAEARPDTRLDA
jgi:hypothetical protein